MRTQYNTFQQLTYWLMNVRKGMIYMFECACHPLYSLLNSFLLLQKFHLHE